MKIDPKSLVRTCTACPSQWEGKTVDNRPVYIRYRWDNLTVRIGEVGETNKDFLAYDVDKPWPEPILSTSIHGDGMSGFLDNQDLHRILIEGELSSDPSVILENEPPMEFDPEAFEALLKLMKKKSDD